MFIRGYPELSQCYNLDNQTATYQNSVCLTNHHTKNPPVLNSGFYDKFKKDVEIWKLATELTPAKRGPALYLSLPDPSKARDSVRANVTPAQMSDVDGVAKIIAALDKIFEMDKDQDAYTSFDRLVKFRRPSSMNIQEYLIEFDLLLSKAKANNMELKDGTIAYFLLSCANLPEEKEALCRATCTTLSYEMMKKQIERVAHQTNNSKTSSETKTERVDVQFYTENSEENYEEYCDDYYENEDEYFTENQQEYQNQEEPTADTFYSNQQYKNPNFAKPNHQQPQMNAPDESGRPSACSFCKCIFHWVQDCPHAPPNRRFNRGKGRGRFFRGGNNYSRGGPSGGGRPGNRRPPQYQQTKQF